MLKGVVKKAIKAIEDPKLFLAKAAELGWLNWWLDSDEKYLKFVYRMRMGKKLNLDNPQTFNEKLQWLKLHDRKPEYTMMVDKIEVKKYVAGIIGEEYIIPTLGVWNSFDEIDFDKLPEQFVLKCNHDSGSVVIVRDKSKFDKQAAKEKLTKALKRNLYYYAREWPYKDVVPKIFAEEYMEDNSTDVNNNGERCLKVYKFMTFDGVPKIIQTITNDKTEEESIDYFDLEWNKMNLRQNYPNSIVLPECPEKLKEMVEKVKKLCGEAFVRVDLYEINGEIKFSEFTFYSDAGLAKFYPEAWDKKLGDMITLPEEIGGGYAIKCKDFVLWLHEEKTKESELIDYKFLCFDGVTKCSFTCSDRFLEKGLQVTFFDNDWKVMPFDRHYPRVKEGLLKPKNFELMKTLAEKLSQGICFVRVDFYEISGKVYFGELTFYPGSGYEEFTPEEWDYKIGSWIDL